MATLICVCVSVAGDPEISPMWPRLQQDQSSRILYYCTLSTIRQTLGQPGLWGLRPTLITLVLRGKVLAKSPKLFVIYLNNVRSVIVLYLHMMSA